MTKTSTLTIRSVPGALVLAVGLTALALLLAARASAGPAIGVNPAAPTATSGVSFTVSTGGGNRDFVSVIVNCDNGYATVLTVEVPAKGSGTSQTIFPPAGNCTADEAKLMQIGKQHILASASFTVSP